jgi:hypothetical protein
MKGLEVGLTGPWHFYEKKVCSACWSVQFQLFEQSLLTFATLVTFHFQAGI